MNLFKKSSVWKLMVAIFTLSLYAHIAEAKGVATVLTVIFVVVLVVLAVAIAFTPILEAFGGMLAAGQGAWGAVGYVVGATLAASIPGMMVGQVQCLVGQDNVFFSGCSEEATTPTGWQGAAGSPVLTNEFFTATCNSVSLTYDISGANQYGIYRIAPGETSSSLINQGSASGLTKITYTDTAVVPHVTYQYVLVLTNDSGQQFQYPPINAYTNCLPSCTFGADKNQVSYPADIILSWNCQEATSCSIAPEVGSVSATSGQTTLTPTEDTSYVLTCSNIDGSTSLSTSVDVVNPERREVPPGL